jgi:hypothetical protein
MPRSMAGRAPKLSSPRGLIWRAPDGTDSLTRRRPVAERAAMGTPRTAGCERARLAGSIQAARGPRPTPAGEPATAQSNDGVGPPDTLLFRLTAASGARDTPFEEVHNARHHGKIC